MKKLLRLAAWLALSTPAMAEMPVLQHIDQHAKGLAFYDEAGDKYFISGFAQFDYRYYAHDQGGMPENDLLFRRGRTSFEADLPDKLGLRAQFEWNQERPDPLDLYVEKGFGESGLELRAGRFKPPFASEQIMGVGDIFFIERGMTNNFIPARDVGLQIDQSWGKDRLRLEAGLFGGNTDRASSTTDQSGSPEFVARLITNPWKGSGGWAEGLSLGLSASMAEREGGQSVPQLTSMLSPGQAPVFRYRSGTVADGGWSRLIPQFFYQQDNTAILGEWVMARQSVSLGGQESVLLHHAAQISGTYVFTGETPGKRGGTVPNNPVTDGGYGALEATVRAQSMRLDEDAFARVADPALSVDAAHGGGVGLGWYPVRRLRLSVNYDYTAFEGGTGAGDRDPEHALFTRLQVRL